MEHRTLDELRPFANVEQALPVTRRERLERWADLLEQDPTRRVRSLREIEFCTPAERFGMRADQSALSVAYADPVLRAAGLASDRLGDAIAFFELSEADTHRILCSCRHGFEREAGAIARIIRSAAKPASTLNVWLACGMTAAILGPVAIQLFG